MPDIEIDPGDYRERKPKGWRWRLPWSHPDDTKLPMVMFFVAAAFLVGIFLNLEGMSQFAVFIGTLVFGAGAGGMFMLWFRD